MAKCDHPECTGNHKNGTVRGVKMCPSAIEKSVMRTRKWRARDHRAQYVYAVLVNNAALKIGTSTIGYKRQQNLAVGRHRKVFGPVDHFVMAWHHVGDKGVETFLQWRAGRIWKPMVDGSRHSEWFDVTGVSAQDVVKHLRRWYTQIEKLDEWDAEQERLVP